MFSMMKLAIFSLMAVSTPESVDSQEQDTNNAVTTEQMDKVLSKLEKLSKEIEDQVSALEEESGDLASDIQE